MRSSNVQIKLYTRQKVPDETGLRLDKFLSLVRAKIFYYSKKMRDIDEPRFQITWKFVASITCRCWLGRIASCIHRKNHGGGFDVQTVEYALFNKFCYLSNITIGGHRQINPGNGNLQGLVIECLWFGGKLDPNLPVNIIRRIIIRVCIIEAEKTCVSILSAGINDCRWLCWWSYSVPRRGLAMPASAKKL